MDPVLLKRLKKSFETQNISKAYDLMKRYEEEYYKKRADRLEMRDRLRTLG